MEAWAALQGVVDQNKQKAAFARNVMDNLDAIFKPTDVTMSDTTVTSKLKTEEDTWISFKKFADEEGYDQTIIMVDARTVLSRRNKKLPSDCGIKYPWCLQVSHEVEKGIKTDGMEKRVSKNAVADVDTGGEIADLIRTAMEESMQPSSSDSQPPQLVPKPAPAIAVLLAQQTSPAEIATVSDL